MYTLEESCSMETFFCTKFACVLQPHNVVNVAILDELVCNLELAQQVCKLALEITTHCLGALVHGIKIH